MEFFGALVILISIIVNWKKSLFFSDIMTIRRHGAALLSN